MSSTPASLGRGLVYHTAHTPTEFSPVQARREKPSHDCFGPHHCLLWTSRELAPVVERISPDDGRPRMSVKYAWLAVVPDRRVRASGSILSGSSSLDPRRCLECCLRLFLGRGELSQC